jgi:mono/diheme cytochrome c family protein
LKLVKGLAAAIAVLAVLAAAAFAAAVAWGERKAQRTVEVRVVPVPFTRDAAALKSGKYLYESRGCAECHGADGAGRVAIDQPGGLFVRTPSIAPGAGGVTAEYIEADWVRAIRHGVDRNGRPLLVMPSVDYNRLSDYDLAAIVAYVRALPSVKPGAAEIRLPLLVKAAYGAGLVKDAAERIDHRLAPAAQVPPGVNVEHGAYVAAMCVGCHGEDFAGGPIPGAPPDWPPAANLAPGPNSAMLRYDEPAKFVAMMRAGRRPDGTAVSPVMPFTSLGRMNDTDLEAIYAYLKALPPRRPGA